MNLTNSILQIIFSHTFANHIKRFNEQYCNEHNYMLEYTFKENYILQINLIHHIREINVLL